MLEYFLIVFVIALALAPLSHFLPSKRQRKVASMREYAAVHGLFVEFRALPDVGGMQLATGISSGQAIYYGRRLPNKRAGQIDSGTWIHSAEGWRSLGRRLPVPSPLLALSKDISVASVDQFSCGIYWTESSGEGAVEQIRQVLEGWSEQLIR
ncbi:MAG: hypothetical protein P8J79_12410 [Halioglobus sp.]|nr:hypothetical protein [Halioglobus sp.]